MPVIGDYVAIETKEGRRPYRGVVTDVVPRKGYLVLDTDHNRVSFVSNARVLPDDMIRRYEMTRVVETRKALDTLHNWQLDEMAKASTHRETLKDRVNNDPSLSKNWQMAAKLTIENAEALERHKMKTNRWEQAKDLIAHIPSRILGAIERTEQNILGRYAEGGMIDRGQPRSADIPDNRTRVEQVADWAKVTLSAYRLVPERVAERWAMDAQAEDGYRRWTSPMMAKHRAAAEKLAREIDADEERYVRDMREVSREQGRRPDPQVMPDGTYQDERSYRAGQREKLHETVSPPPIGKPSENSLKIDSPEVLSRNGVRFVYRSRDKNNGVEIER